MSESLNNLKSAMKKSVFKDLSFTDECKMAVRNTIRTKQNKQQLGFWNEITLIALLESLQQEPKHGYDISTYLFQKHDFSFQRNQGQLYTLLHLLESKEMVTSKWVQDKKYYSLTAKGKKYVASYKKGRVNQVIALKHILEEASL